MRITATVPSRQYELWTDEAARSLVGQTAPVTLDVGAGGAPVAEATVTWATVIQDGTALLLELELDELDDAVARALTVPGALSFRQEPGA